MKLALEFFSNRTRAALIRCFLCGIVASIQSASVVAAAVENSEATSADGGARSDDWSDLLMSDRKEVREEGVQKAPNNELGIFLAENGARFVRDESRRIRYFLASWSRDTEVLAELSGDSDYLVRSCALSNFATPVKALTTAVDRIGMMPDEELDLSNPASHGLLSEIEALMSNPRLPQDAYRSIYASARQISSIIPPMGRDVPFEAMIEYGSILGLHEEDETFKAWKNGLTHGQLDRPAARIEMMEHDDLQDWALSSREVPIKTLLSHVRKLLDQSYVNEETLARVAMNANLGSKAPEADQLVQLLLSRKDEYVDRSLAGNPDLPAAVLRTLALDSQARDEAEMTLWQVYGERP